MAFPLVLTCASRDRWELIRNPNSVTRRQTSDNPTVNNQVGLHLFSLTGGGANMIPVVIVDGIAMWLAWKGWKAFRKYEDRKEARAPKATRDQLRREGDQLSSNDDSDDNNGGGSRGKEEQKNKKRVRFHNDDLHSDCLLYTSPSPRDS